MLWPCLAAVRGCIALTLSIMTSQCRGEHVESEQAADRVQQITSVCLLILANRRPFTSTILIWHLIGCHGSPSHSWIWLSDRLTLSSLKLGRNAQRKEDSYWQMTSVQFAHGHWVITASSGFCRTVFRAHTMAKKKRRKGAAGACVMMCRRLPVGGHVLLLGSLFSGSWLVPVALWLSVSSALRCTDV